MNPPSPSGSPPGTEWQLAAEGLPLGWAFLLLLVCAVACWWLYRKSAPTLSPAWRNILTALRILAFAIVLVLLARPVLHITLNEPVRQSLLVLLDASQSMELADRRTTPEDVRRAEIATGEAEKKGASLTRWELLRRLFANPALALWPRLQEKSNVIFYRFGRDAALMGPLAEEASATTADAVRVFEGVTPDQPATGLGEALRQVIDQNRGQPVSGILVITDGAGNSGMPPVEAARLARENRLPLFLYGVGVTSPIDLVVRDVSTPRLAFVKEKVDVRARIHTQGIGRRSVPALLSANGVEVDRRDLELTEDGDAEITFSFHPQEVGDLNLTVTVPALDEETSDRNNAAETRLRIVDNKIKVLFIDQEPRWDFRYLLAYLQRDRRLDVKSVLIDGEPGLDTLPGSPFLPGLPEDRDGIFQYEIIILGDVDPASLGETRMRLLEEWVDQSGGGLIFLAGPKFDPSAYASTPLDALLPVVPDLGVASGERLIDPVPLRLTSLGETSPYLRLDEDAEENVRLWNSFPGVRWVAPIARAKPAAEVLLVDPRGNGPDGTPVIAVQGYGAGQTVYIGTDETYRLRSKVGEKYYSQVWGAIMQSLSLKRLEGASTRTQLTSARERYFVGDRVVISGKIYQAGFQPLTAPSLQGVLKHTGFSAAGTPEERTDSLDVTATGAQPGEFRAEFVARSAGAYSYATLDDPAAVVKFEVVEPRIEQMETALNDRTLEAMAAASSGRFLREEDLATLPDLVANQTATVATFRKRELYHSGWWMAALVAVLGLEWLMRRMHQQK